ncbi:MAG: DUF2723 domain-containing protein [Bacteroidales bacterium]|nr:DUF2723 domain-containing protein [Bacteroidales bacterium]
MKRFNYNIINNSLGWLCFLVAAVTYQLTLEPTASFWDCPEFISQGAKLEVGHPPGNPIFMLAARFAINFTGGNLHHAAIAVNAMNALLSAGTILLLFWSITHLTRRLVARGESHLTLPQLIAVMGSGLCGALVYTWSDTFWFSAVEGEVYAFSSFCTALVFWLILKWENRADAPESDRYLILIAYIIGISIAVHLLNLLCIPAIALVVYYRKWGRPTLLGSLLTIAIAGVIIALILYGLVPGFIGVAGEFEVFCVNTLGMSYNLGVLIYALILVSVMIWCIRSLYRISERYSKSTLQQVRISFLLTVFLSGMPFIGSGLAIPVILVLALAIYLFTAKKLPIRILTIVATSILVIFIGYSSYALLLIRSNANPPMNQNAPDNVFDLASYLSRDQYGDTPLLKGPAFTSTRLITPSADGQSAMAYVTTGAPTYQKAADGSGKYVTKEGAMKVHYAPEMLFPRMYSTAPGHAEEYLKWSNSRLEDFPSSFESIVVDADGNPIPYYNKQSVRKPTFAQNLRFFLNYQFGHMYWRYFMWNFAGRQNDLQGQGELNRGNWISGIPFIDNHFLGDQSLLPAEQGKDNPGHNVFYMLPLLMGIIGLLWQSMDGERGIEQFWVIFMLFFMTGIAIVLYLNQPPMQVRERDYAFAGSFYAFSIWVGMGVAALWRLFMTIRRKVSHPADDSMGIVGRGALIGACCAAVIGLIVPLQMVSQTWDDHDRSGRYTARDYGMNYLASLDDNAIIFTNGDNDTFPLWYAQEVEGFRTDVRVVNLSYLTTPWYAYQQAIPSYDAGAIPMQAKPEDYALERLQLRYFNTADKNPKLMTATDVLASAYANDANTPLPSYLVAIPSNAEAARAKGVINPEDSVSSFFMTNLWTSENMPAMYQNSILALDYINQSATDGWERPVYFAMTVPNDYYLGLENYMRNTGLTYQVTPSPSADGTKENIAVNTDKMYRNVTERFRWGGLDNLDDDETVYLDETVRRMVSTHRMSLYDLAAALYNEGFDAAEAGDSVQARERFDKSLEILNLMQEKLPTRLSPYTFQIGERIGSLYVAVGEALRDQKVVNQGLDILHGELTRYAAYIPYLKSLIEREGGRKVGQRYSISVYDLPVSAIDTYVPYHLSTLLQSYNDCGGDVEQLDAELKEQDIDIIYDITALTGQDLFGLSKQPK